MFDVFIPLEYPNCPPLVQFLTTGRGQFRFNANLYRDGKVCLSLLGTWSGPGWEPQTSTLLQVFLSIQSMIMCADAYYNEPGFDRLRGTKEGEEVRATSAPLRVDMRRNSLIRSAQLSPQSSFSPGHVGLQSQRATRHTAVRVRLAAQRAAARL